MADTYSVVMTGKIAQGMAVEQVKANVGKLFKLGDEQLDKLFSGKPVAVSRGLERKQADKLCAALAKAGAVARIKSSQPLAAAPKRQAAAPTASSKPGEEQKSSPAPGKAKKQGTTPAELQCPRCGHEQPFTTACSLCKMDLTLHIQRLKRKERIRAFRQKTG